MIFPNSNDSTLQPTLGYTNAPNATYMSDDTLEGMHLISDGDFNDPIGLQFHTSSNAHAGLTQSVVEIRFQGQVIALNFVPGNIDTAGLQIHSLFHLLREDMLPLYLGADAKDVQLVLAFEDADEPVLYEGDTVGSDLNLGDYQELAALANRLEQPPRLELLYRESLPHQLSRLRTQDLATYSDSETSESGLSSESDWSWSIPSSPREMTPDAPQLVAAVADQENNLESDLGRVVVLFAPVRRITRSMTRAAENAAQPEPELVGVANRPKRVIRRVVLDYDDIIHNVPAAIHTSRL